MEDTNNINEYIEVNDKCISKINKYIEINDKCSSILKALQEKKIDLKTITLFFKRSPYSTNMRNPSSNRFWIF